MTDNEIIKALESKADYNCDMCCDNNENCDGDYCEKIISQSALNLINRQKELLEMAEKAMKIANEDADLMRKQYECVKSEAIREFSEKLKQQAYECDIYSRFGKEHFAKAVAVIDIERLVEEMTEGENG